MEKLEKTILRCLAIIFAAFFLLLALIPFVRYEYLTIRYGNEFTEEYKEAPYSGSTLDYLKVITYSESYAEVYFVVDGSAKGCVYSFVKSKNEWKYVACLKVVWIAHGNYDLTDFFWPYLIR